MTLKFEEFNVIPLPKSASLPKVEFDLQFLGLQDIAKMYLQQNFGVDSLDELLDQKQIYEYVDRMREIIEDAEKHRDVF